MNRLILLITLFTGVFVQQGNAQQTVSAKFNQALDKYYVLKNALAKDQPAAAQQAALVLSAAVKEVPHKGFSSDQQHQLWMKESAAMQTQLASIAKSGDLKVQRKSFEGVSNSFVKLAEELKLNTKTVFIQYCPMVKASWLNEVKAVQNPYYGSMMYDCGEVKSTIAKK
ncbi:DUF3347 domain-containing protein [Pedobacter sp. AW31-3R]|uniref:DUF3347 domain-containing protein n=1 Tax=Pedobacter sp. AW31-3R TaxID=3445781 RepID=UPI003FA194D7